MPSMVAFSYFVSPVDNSGVHLTPHSKTQDQLPSCFPLSKIMLPTLINGAVRGHFPPFNSIIATFYKITKERCPQGS